MGTSEKNNYEYLHSGTDSTPVYFTTTDTRHSSTIAATSSMDSVTKDTRTVATESTAAVESPVVVKHIAPQPPGENNNHDMVVNVSSLVRKGSSKEKLAPKFAAFCLGIGYSLLIAFPLMLLFGWLLGSATLMGFWLGYMLGIFYWILLFRVVLGLTGISLGIRRNIKKKETTDEENAEAPPTTTNNLEDVQIVVSPANPWATPEDQQQFLRVPGEAEIALHKKALLRYGMFLLVVGITPMLALVLWHTKGDAMAAVVCVLGYFVGICYQPVVSLAMICITGGSFFWMFKDAVVAEDGNNEKKEGGNAEKQVELVERQ